MNVNEFDTLLEKRIVAIRHTLSIKGKEYGFVDRLHNFKRAGEITQTTAQQALIGMFLKHLVSVLDIVEGRLQLTEYLINEKIGDSINYLILLEAILKEEIFLEQKKEKCPECERLSHL